MSGTTVVSYLFVFVGLSLAYKDCIPVTPVSVDESWIIKSGKSEGFNVLEHSECNNCEKGESWSWLKGRASPKRLCLTVEGAFKDSKEFTLPSHCEYAFGKINQLNYKIDFTSTKNKNLALAGTTTMVMTDNATYVAAVDCLFGKENFWYIFTVGDSGLEEAEKTKIEEKFKELGFTAPVAVEGTSPIFLKKIHIKQC